LTGFQLRLHLALLSALPETFCSQAFALVTNHPKKEMGRYLMCLFTMAFRHTRK
jgi:hypothetical protein